MMSIGDGLSGAIQSDDRAHLCVNTNTVIPAQAGIQVVIFAEGQDKRGIRLLCGPIDTTRVIPAKAGIPFPSGKVGWGRGGHMAYRLDTRFRRNDKESFIHEPSSVACGVIPTANPEKPTKNNKLLRIDLTNWIPAFAGMTNVVGLLFLGAQ